MISKCKDFTSYPICDTDIWVKISLGGIHKELFKKHEKIIVADVVEGEILNWNRYDDSKFKFIAEQFLHYKNNGDIYVINHEEDISKEDRRFLERQLYDLGFENDFNNNPSESDKGEFVSAIYADYFGISLMKSNDGAFGDSGRGEIAFPELEVKNWYITTEELITDDRRRHKIRALVEKNSKQMESEHKKRKENIEGELLESKIKAYQLMYSKG